ncbi:MAG TPA: hypothetical protein VF970_10975 [Gemmatimonadales bacterium]
MFGQFYHRRDQGVAGKPSERTTTRLEYAAGLLAELLNRAENLYDGQWRRAFEVKNEDAADYLEAMEAFFLAGRAFLHDCREARVRAQRVRLVYEDRSGFLIPFMDGVPYTAEADLAKIGGALVPDVDDEEAGFARRIEALEKVVPELERRVVDDTGAKSRKAVRRHQRRGGAA